MSTRAVTVHLASVLRAHAGGAASVTVEVAEPVTVAAVLDALGASHPAVGRRVRDEAGGVRRHVNVFVGGDNVRDLGGPAAAVPPGADVSVLAAVSGG